MQIDVFRKFGLFCIAVNDAIIQWEKENGKSYASDDIEIETDLLSAMFQIGMTPEEVAGTLTSSNMRILTDYQQNVHVAGTVLDLAKSKGLKIAGVILKAPDKEVHFVLGPETSPFELPHLFHEVMLMLKKTADEIIKKRNDENKDS